MNMIRVGRIVFNLEHVIDIIQGDPDGPHPEGLTVNFISGQKHSFIGDDALGLRAYVDRTVKSATVPLKDFEVK